MAEKNAHVHGLHVGELSNAALARVDIERVALAAEIQENILAHVIGKGQFRPGTKYLGATKSNNRARLIPFVKSLAATAVFELTAGKLRVWVDDELVTRPSVVSTITDGNFSSLSGWTSVVSGDATAVSSGGMLVLTAIARGGIALVKQQVTTSSANIQHALTIVVDRGPVTFRCGSTDGADDYISETTLATGTHSLAFTPTGGSYWVQFVSRSVTQVKVDSITVASVGVMELDAPWSEDDLREIRFDQSGDVVFLAHADWQPRKIERRGDHSWSLVKFYADDGPFVLARTANVRLKPGSTRGNTTLTADAAFFTEDHVGALFRLTHDRFYGTFNLGAEESFTDVFRVSGVKEERSGTTYYNDRDFAYSVADGATTWVGGGATIRNYRSVTSEDSGFKRFPRASAVSTVDITANASFQNDDEDDNLVAYYRIGFEAGAYVSGSAIIQVNYDGHGGSGICRVTSYTSPTVVNIEILEDIKNFQYTSDWLEGAWSDARGWPSAVAFFDGRLFFAASDEFWASESDAFTLFGLDTEGDAASIQRSIATGGAVAKCHWLLPLQRLQFGTEGAIISARSSSFDEPLTPTQCTLKDASTQGAGAVSPVKIDGRGIFVDRSAKRLFDLAYDVESNDYRASDLTKYNDAITGDGIVEIAAQRQPESYIWCVRDDGEVAILIYDPGEKVAGWVRYIPGGTDAEVESVCVLPENGQDRVYLAVKRTVNGATVRYVEKLAKHSEAIGGATNLIADCYVTSEAEVSSITAAHLASETGLVGWGTTGGVAQPITGLSANSSGVISLGASYTNVMVGIGYSGRYKSAKLAYAAEHGTALLAKKHVTELGLLLENTHINAITYGADFTTMRPMPRVENGTVQAETTVYDVYDEATVAFPGTWDTDARLCLKVSAPYPATLLGLVVGVETND